MKNSFTNRPAGKYNLTVTDTKGCTASFLVTITGPATVWHYTGQKTSSGTGSSLSVPCSDNKSTGDLIILTFTLHQNPGADTGMFSIPTGFTKILNKHLPSSNARPEIVAFYNIATISGNMVDNKQGNNTACESITVFQAGDIAPLFNKQFLKQHTYLFQ